MHVEINVALNFVISYLYNKLPRRRVDLFGTELENGLKKKFEGHWYPKQPMKGSGYRCVRVSGEKIDPVIIKAASNVGVNLEEMKEYMPLELTLWIDPDEVSYKIGEKGQVKILYSDKNNDDNTENEDREVQATNRGFNPEAQTFNPEAQVFNPDATSFEPIDRLSASLGNINLSPRSGGLSPMSPVSPLSWGGSQSTSPSGGAPFPPHPPPPVAPPTNDTVSPPPASSAGQQKQQQQRQGNQLFTTATFAQTKFGSTKLKSNAKRPTRLSPTEFGNFLRQKAVPANIPQYPPTLPPTLPPTSTARARSLSPRDPRVEFLMDQHQRFLHNQHQQQLQQQFHQQQQQQQLLHQQQLNYQLQQQQLQQHQQQQHPNRLNIPAEGHYMAAGGGQQVSGSLHDMFSGPSPLQSPDQSPVTNGHSPGQAPHLFPGFSAHSSNNTGIHGNLQTTVNSLQISPENQKALFDGLGINNGAYSPSSQYHHLLLAT